MWSAQDVRNTPHTCCLTSYYSYIWFTVFLCTLYCYQKPCKYMLRHKNRKNYVPATQCVATGIQIILYGLPVTIQHNEKYSEPDFTLLSQQPAFQLPLSTYLLQIYIVYKFPLTDYQQLHFCLPNLSTHLVVQYTQRCLYV